MVPLQLQAISQQNTKMIWENHSTSSTNYCRPIKFEFETESKEKVIADIKIIKSQVDKLKPTKVIFNGDTYSVNYEMLCRMVDGKVCQYLTDTSAASVCVVCKAKPSEMNKLSNLNKKNYI